MEQALFSQFSQSGLLSRPETAPEPRPADPLWKTRLLKLLGEQSEARWGTQLIRIARDMILVCDQELTIHFHNQGFVSGLGFRDGSYKGQSLLQFFPEEDRDAAKRAFCNLRSGRMRGIAIEATFLGKSKPVLFGAEVTRSRRRDGSYFYYMIARPKVETPVGRRALRTDTQVVGMRAEAALGVAAPIPADAGDFLDLLPVAAWRCDGESRLVAVSGRLWDDLRIDGASSLGAELGAAKSPDVPGLLAEIKPSVRAAVRSSKARIEFRGKGYDVHCEPLKGPAGEYAGCVGYVRTAVIESVPAGGNGSGPMQRNRSTTVVVDPVACAAPATGRARDLEMTAVVPITPIALTPPPFRCSGVLVETAPIAVRIKTLVASAEPSDVALPR